MTDEIHKTGKSTTRSIYIDLRSGDTIAVVCTDWSDEMKYIEMLKAGGSKHHSELLKPFGLDASDPKFWNKGLSVISRMIDELEKMEE